MHRSVPAASALLACLVVLSSTVATAQTGARSCVAPTGGDDTALLQAQLDRCSGAGPGCSVRLCSGVFRTGILRVRDFRGTLRGAGASATTLRALPELPVNTNATGFLRDDPFAPGSDPWPYLLQFVEGRATIQDLGILIPDPPDPQRPTSGWFLLEDLGPFFELRGAILLTGRERVDFEVRRVRVEAEADALSLLETTAFGGVEFAGLLFDPAADPSFPVFPARGSFRMSDSELVGMASGTPMSELAQSLAIVSQNRYRTALAVDVIDVDHSQVAILSNRWQVSMRGVQVIQNLDGAPSLASGIWVDGNFGVLSPFFAGTGDGIAFQDPIDASPSPGESVLWATRNRLEQRDGAGPAASGITAVGAADLRLLDNRLKGAVGVGIRVDVTRGCLVAGNSTSGLSTGTGPDVHLGPGTQGCTARVGRDDLVLDQGAGNRVIRR
jgi:hypothetical protein